MSINRDWVRRESVMVVPGADDVLDEYAHGVAPMERRDMAFGFRKFTSGDNDAGYDALMAWLAPGNPLRLVYQTDSGAFWYTMGRNPRVTHSDTAAAHWGKGGETAFTVTWRIGVWTPRYSETAELFRTPSTFAAATTFGSLGTTAITSASQLFNVDATGTAGVNLPTLPDTGPIVTVTGPAGGDGGLRVSNGAALVQDTNGAWVSMYFDIPFKLPTAYDQATLRFASQSFIADGLSFRPSKPAYQRDFWQIAPGVVNNCAAVAQGANAVTGGKIKVEFWRKRA